MSLYLATSNLIRIFQIVITPNTYVLLNLILNIFKDKCHNVKPTAGSPLPEAMFEQSW